MKRLKEQLLKRKTILAGQRKLVSSLTQEEVENLGSLTSDRFEEASKADSLDSRIFELDSILNLIDTYER